MKKILAYLLVLVSLMTLFCGTAGADEIYYTSRAVNSYYEKVNVTNLSTGKTVQEKIAIGFWTVEATCKYEQGNNMISPLAAWASSVTGTTYNAGGGTDRVGKPSESTRTFYEGLNRSKLEHYYTCSMIMYYAENASKYDSSVPYSKYSYGPKTSPHEGIINTMIEFLRKY